MLSNQKMSDLAAGSQANLAFEYHGPSRQQPESELSPVITSTIPVADKVATAAASITDVDKLQSKLDRAGPEAEPSPASADVAPSAGPEVEPSPALLAVFPHVELTPSSPCNGSMGPEGEPSPDSRLVLPDSNVLRSRKGSECSGDDSESQDVRNLFPAISSFMCKPISVAADTDSRQPSPPVTPTRIVSFAAESPEIIPAAGRSPAALGSSLLEAAVEGDCSQRAELASWAERAKLVIERARSPLSSPGLLDRFPVEEPSSIPTTACVDGASEESNSAAHPESSVLEWALQELQRQSLQAEGPETAEAFAMTAAEIEEEAKRQRAIAVARQQRAERQAAAKTIEPSSEPSHVEDSTMEIPSSVSPAPVLNTGHPARPMPQWPCAPRLAALSADDAEESAALMCSRPAFPGVSSAVDWHKSPQMATIDESRLVLPVAKADPVVSTRKDSDISPLRSARTEAVDFSPIVVSSASSSAACFFPSGQPTPLKMHCRVKPADSSPCRSLSPIRISSRPSPAIRDRLPNFQGPESDHVQPGHVSAGPSEVLFPRPVGKALLEELRQNAPQPSMSRLEVSAPSTQRCQGLSEVEALDEEDLQQNSAALVKAQAASQKRRYADRLSDVDTLEPSSAPRAQDVQCSRDAGDKSGSTLDTLSETLVNTWQSIEGNLIGAFAIPLVSRKHSDL